MRHFLTLLFLVCLAAAARGQAPPATVTIALDGHTFTLPEGFTVERAAGPPVVNRPVAIDFDERGRLYATEMDGAIEKPDVQAQKKAHRVLRLQDIDGDGKFDKSTVFADQLPFPEGMMWRQGSVYVAAPPQIWKLTDTDDDGVADRREIWFDGQTITGCANDLHGPYAGPDGWIYWCKGAFARQTYTLPTGKSFSTRASHIFRARPDGTGIEPVMTGGMDNPVDVVFTPGGERIFTTTFLQRPAAGLRDGLIHAIYGGIYGKDQDAIYEPDHKWTSPELMPVLVHLGPAAPCGLHRYESNQFGPAYENNILACEFNLRKISRHVLKPSGSTFTTEDSDLIVSDNTDFHPTDVIEDADGSILVVNTGGWYKLCCPSSQLVKADILGGIYRIRKTGSHLVVDPRGSQTNWQKLSTKELVGLLGDARPAVRHQAIETLASQGPAALEAISGIVSDPKSGAVAARSAISVASRIDGPAARQVIQTAFRHQDESVRQFAIHAASAWRDRTSTAKLIEALSSPSLHNRRAAAEALGRLGDASAVPSLLTALADPKNDRALDHSLTYALIEIGDEASLRPALAAKEPRVQRAALVALDQIGATLDPQLVLAHLDDSEKSLRDSARWIAGRHAEWGPQLTDYLRSRLSSVTSEEEQSSLVELLAKLAKNEATQRLLAEVARSAKQSPAPAGLALRVMIASELKELPTPWISALLDLLSPDSALVAEALAAARAIPPTKSDAGQLAAALIKLGDSNAAAPLRLTALAAVPGGLKSVTPGHFSLLVEHIDRDQPAELRAPAADVLSRSKLSADQLLQLAKRLPRCGPVELDRLLTSFTQSTDDAVGLLLVSILDQPNFRSSLSAETVKQRLAKYGSAVQAEAQKLCAAIDAEHGQESARLQETLASLPSGDIRRGQTMFNSAKISCRACHTIGYVGGRIGPDLTRIGQIRQKRDLLESILFPSASFVRSYEPVALRTLDGQVHSGIIKSEASTEIVLTVAADKEVRIAREEIDELQPGKVSVMPAGLDKQLSLQDLADLVEFLCNCK
jgi:putative membrane-bound dehydrogenase-like protein